MVAEPRGFTCTAVLPGTPQGCLACSHSSQVAMETVLHHRLLWLCDYNDSLLAGSNNKKEFWALFACKELTQT